MRKIRRIRVRLGPRGRGSDRGLTIHLARRPSLVLISTATLVGLVVTPASASADVVSKGVTLLAADTTSLGGSDDQIQQTLYAKVILDSTAVSTENMSTEVDVPQSAVDMSKDPDASAAAVAASTCKARTSTRSGQNILNQTMWTMSMTTSWCWNGSKITYKFHSETQSSPGTGWRLESSNVSGSSGNNPWTRYFHVEFKHCVHIPVLDVDVCGEDSNPWIQRTMTKTGTATVDSDIQL
jgi:hypothetical protein